MQTINVRSWTTWILLLAFPTRHGNDVPFGTAVVVREIDSVLKGIHAFLEFFSVKHLDTFNVRAGLRIVVVRGHIGLVLQFNE